MMRERPRLSVRVRRDDDVYSTFTSDDPTKAVLPPQHDGAGSRKRSRSPSATDDAPPSRWSRLSSALVGATQALFHSIVPLFTGEPTQTPKQRERQTVELPRASSSAALQEERVAVPRTSPRTPAQHPSTPQQQHQTQQKAQSFSAARGSEHADRETKEREVLTPVSRSPQHNSREGSMIALRDAPPPQVTYNIYYVNNGIPVPVPQQPARSPYEGLESACHPRASVSYRNSLPHLSRRDGGSQIEGRHHRRDSDDTMYRDSSALTPTTRTHRAPRTPGSAPIKTAGSSNEKQAPETSRPLPSSSNGALNGHQPIRVLSVVPTASLTDSKNGAGASSEETKKPEPPSFGNASSTAAPPKPASGSNPFSFGSTNGNAPKAQSNPFSFGNTSASTSAKPPASTPASPPAATPAVTTTAKPGGFFKAGPPAVITDDDGFAPNAGSDDDDNGKTAPPKAANPTTFSFGGSSGTSFGAAPAPAPATESKSTSFNFGNTSSTAAPKPASGSNPFSVGNTSASTSASPPASTPAAPPAAKPGGFFKAGPPAVITDDDGFAPNAGSDDDDSGKTAPPKASNPTTFSFGGSSGTSFGAAPATESKTVSFNFGNAASTAAPKPASGSNTFSFGNTSASTSEKPPASTPAAPPAVAPAVTATAKPGGFFKAGPPAVITDDDGFAPNAGSDDDDSGKTAPPKAANPTTFSFGGSSGTSFGAAPAPGTESKSTSFNFGNTSSTAAPKPASGSNPFSFGNISAPTTSANTFSFGNTSGSAPSASSNLFSFGNASS